MLYLVIRVDDDMDIRKLARIIAARFSFILPGYEIGTPEDVYYNASNVCEDITRVTVLIKREEDDN